MPQPAYSPQTTRAPAREDIEVVFRDGPFSAESQPLSEAEQAFLKALEGVGKPGSRYSMWAAKVRDDWHVRTGTPRRDE